MIKNFKKGYFVFTSDPRHEHDNAFWCEYTFYADTKRELENFLASYDGDESFYNWLQDDIDFTTYSEKEFNMSMKRLLAVEIAGSYDFGVTIYDLAMDVFIPVSPFYKKGLKVSMDGEAEDFRRAADLARLPPCEDSLSKRAKIRQLTEELHKLTHG